MKYVNLSKMKRLGFAVSHGLHPSDVLINLCLFSDTRMCSSGRRQLKDEKLDNLVFFCLVCCILSWIQSSCVYIVMVLQRDKCSVWVEEEFLCITLL